MPSQLPPVLAALALSVFISIYLLVSLNAPEGFARVFVALSFCYGVAFFLSLIHI